MRHLLQALQIVGRAHRELGGTQSRAEAPWHLEAGDSSPSCPAQGVWEGQPAAPDAQPGQGHGLAGASREGCVVLPAQAGQGWCSPGKCCPGSVALGDVVAGTAGEPSYHTLEIRKCLPFPSKTQLCENNYPHFTRLKLQLQH